ncbi:MAG: pitrilysin family protein [Myxococcales bacterium]
MTPSALVPRSLTLPNGLRVLAIAQPGLHQVQCSLHVRVGSRFETARTNGISHFLEHMLYRGTPKLPSAHEVSLAFERLGGYLFASTQTDYGVLSLTLPPESVVEATRLFAEVVSEPAFLDIDIERGIVCEEILEDLDDEGRQVDPDNLSRALIYGSHPLGFTITGSDALVQSFHETSLRAHHARHYHGVGAVLAFAGPIDPDKALELAAATFSSLPRGEGIVASAPPNTQKRPRLRIVENVSSQTELRICFRAIAEGAPERMALEMLMRAIDDGMSTRLYHRICDAKGLCYDVSAGFDGYEDDGVVDLAAGVQHARASMVAREILEMLTELAEKGPSEDELTKAKRRHAWDMTAMLDSAEEIGDFFATGLLFGREQWPAERMAQAAQVTAREVREVAQLIVQPSRLNVVAVGLLENDEDKRLTDLVKGWRGLDG